MNWLQQRAFRYDIFFQISNKKRCHLDKNLLNEKLFKEIFRVDFKLIFAGFYVEFDAIYFESYKNVNPLFFD